MTLIDAELIWEWENVAQRILEKNRAYSAEYNWDTIGAGNRKVRVKTCSEMWEG